MAPPFSRTWAALHIRFAAALIIFLASSCGNLPPRTKGPVHVVATIAPLADWSRIVGGARVSVTQLVPAGHDPRSYVLTAPDRDRLAHADILLLNGLRLEPWLESLLTRRSARPPIIIDISEWVNAPEQPAARLGPLPLNPDPGSDQQAPLQGNGPVQPPAASSQYQWLDPAIARQAVTVIAQNLARVDPAALTLYRQNAAAYNAEIENLDNAIQRTINGLPQAQFKDVQNFMQPFRSHFTWPTGTKAVTMRTSANPPELVDALNPGSLGQYTLQLQHGKGRIDPLNNDNYLVLMRTVTQQFVQSLRP